MERYGAGLSGLTFNGHNEGTSIKSFENRPAKHNKDKNN